MDINKRFAQLLPALTEAEKATLEASLLAEGCLDALKTWRGFVVDGHNRFEICQRHGLTFETVELTLATENEVLEWVYRHQLGRRNFTEAQRKYFLGVLYETEKKRVGGDGSNQHGNKSNVVTVTTLLGGDGKRTAETIAAREGLSERTVRNAATYKKAVDALPEADKLPDNRRA